MTRPAWVLAGTTIALLLALVALAAIKTRLYRVEELATQAPRRTEMMAEREAEARAQKLPYRVDQRWVPYDRISPLLRRAILIAEDDGFYTHGGLDWNEIQAAARANLEKGRIVRGGSTITQQLAKNLYVGDRKTLSRKLSEIFLALRLERALTKRRIFELYLNLVEWGDGVYGAEAASQRYFGVPASALSERQAVLLAAVVINPRRYSPTAPARRIEKRVQVIASRLRGRGFLTEEQYRAAIGAPTPAPAQKPSTGRRSGFAGWFFGGRPESATRSGHRTKAAPPDTLPGEAPP